MCVGVHYTLPQRCAPVCVLWMCEDKMFRVFMWLLLFVSAQFRSMSSFNNVINWDISLALHRMEWLTDSNIWIYLSWKMFDRQRWQLKKRNENKSNTLNVDFTLNRIQNAKWLSTTNGYIFIWRNHHCVDNFHVLHCSSAVYDHNSWSIKILWTFFFV